MTEQKKTTPTLLPADLIENDQGRFHPELKLENGCNPTAWIKEHGLKAYIVEIEDADFSINYWKPEPKYQGAFPVAIFQREAWAEGDYTAIFAYENTQENRKIKLQTLAENLNEESAAAYIRLLRLEDALRIEMSAIFDAALITINPNSSDQLSVYLFGGQYKFYTYEPMYDEAGNPVLYGKKAAKAGQHKTKKTEQTRETKGLGIVPDPSWSAKKDGIYFTNDDVIQKLKKQCPERKEILSLILEVREAAKDYKTYFEGYGKLIWPHDQCIHGSIGHVGTNTSRFNSSNPNMQNLSNKGD